MSKKKKTRVELRKNRTKPPRERDWTRGFAEHGYGEEATRTGERVRAKGDMSRKRTIISDDDGVDETRPKIDPAVHVPGRVLRVHGLSSVVQTDDGRSFRCAVRRLLKSLASDERNVVAAGDRVWIRPSLGDEGFIERVEPRHGLLTRASRGREHVIVANVDQVVIVIALAEPALKPHLIDRYLASALQGNIRPIVCLNKVDLVDAAALQPMVGYYSQLGIPTLLTSATTGAGIDRLRRLLPGRETVFSGQSGVGKSSLLNALQPGLGLAVRSVSETTEKGRHTTTTAQLLPFEGGGWVVDTPGIRQFALWDIIAEEVEGFFAEFHAFVALCAFPDCTHTHEDRCAIKDAVQRRQISARRYFSYLGMCTGKMEEAREE
jgi:ribosome biogenesis GTPase / thiamine phosphate phosphatase